MECISVLEAKHLEKFKIWIRFSNGVSGEVDLEQSIFRNKAALTLRNETEFAKFYLDYWPTLAWHCGFDISPEYLYELATGITQKSKEEV